MISSASSLASSRGNTCPLYTREGEPKPLELEKLVMKGEYTKFCIIEQKGLFRQPLLFFI